MGSHYMVKFMQTHSSSMVYVLLERMDGRVSTERVLHDGVGRGF